MDDVDLNSIIVRERLQFLSDFGDKDMEFKQQPGVPAAANPATSRTHYTSNGGTPNSSKDFNLIRPVCVQVMSNPTIQNLHHLGSIISQLPDTIEPCLLDYIVYPLSHHLKLNRKHKEDIRIALHNCVKIVLGKWQMETFPCFAELYQFCMMSICKPEDPGNFDKSLSEDFVEHVVSTIYTLIDGSISKHFKKLYSDRYIAAVGHGVCILLQIVNQDTAKSLRISAINTVLLLIRICDSEPDACHRIFKFLPGLATTFVRCCVIQGGRYQVDIIKESLEALKTSLTVCVSFEKAEDLVAVDTNLSPGINEICESLIFHSENKLRTALADFTVTIIQETGMKLPKCSEALWSNVLVMSSSEEDCEVSSKCLSLLKQSQYEAIVSELCTFKTIEHQLKKSVIQGNVGELTKCCLNSLKVATSFFVVRMSQKELWTLLPRISDLRTITIRRHAEDIKIQQDDLRILRACFRMTRFIVGNYPLEDLIEEFLNILTRYNNPDDISSFKSSGVIRLLNELLGYVASKSKRVTDGGYRRIAEKYISLLSPILSEEVDVESPSKKMDSSTTLSGLCVHTSCILEGFPVLFKLDPQIEILILFPLLEFSGLREAEFICVADTAFRSLEKIANNAVREYLSVNLDLVMSEFASRIEMMTDYPRMTDALIFLAKYFDFSQNRFLGFVQEIIEYSTSKNFETKYHEVFANIYYAYISSMWKYYVSNVKQVSEIKEPIFDHIVAQATSEPKPSLVDRLLKYQSSLGIIVAEDEASESIAKMFRNVELEQPTNENVEEAPPSESNEKDEEQEKLPLSPEVSLTLKIASKAANYLTDPARSIKLISMKILVKSIQILAPFQDELLPLLHSCWITLTCRFLEKDYVVLRMSFELLLTMITYSGNFLRKRTIEGIFPIFSGFLEELSELSKNVDDRNSVYFTYTQGYKLQITILKGLAQLCESMDIGERDLDKIVNACLVYLSPDQHKNLKDAAITLIHTLGYGHHGSSVWMKLLANGIVQIPGLPAHHSFKMIPQDFTNRSSEVSKPKKKFVKRRIMK